MTKYKVTKKFIDELVAWRDKNCLDVIRGYGFVFHDDLEKMPSVVKAWWLYDNTSIERNRRLIAIIQWLNGEGVFDVGESHKFVVRNDKTDSDGDYWYITTKNAMAQYVYHLPYATKFDTREEAQEWANSHQVVIEVDAEGNEV